MKDALIEQFCAALRVLLDEASDTDPLPEFSLEVPRQADHGDFACNAAMLLAKRLGKPPRAIAQRLVELVHPEADRAPGLHWVALHVVRVWSRS